MLLCDFTCCTGAIDDDDDDDDADMMLGLVLVITPSSVKEGSQLGLTIKLATKLRTSHARLAQLLQPSLTFCFS